MESGGEFFGLSTNEVFEKLSSNKNGLTLAEAEQRLIKYGKNALTPPKPPSAWQIYLSQYKNALIIILLAAALMTLGIWVYTGERTDLIEAILIISIIILITAFGFFQEFKAEKALAKIKSLLSFEARVIRGGNVHKVKTIDIVPGDLVVLEEGDKVPADMRILEVSELHIDEAILTGESNPIRKNTLKLTGEKLIAEQTNMAFSGTVVTRGRGMGIVTTTGNETEIGKIAHLVSQTTDTLTPIQKRLNEIGRVIGIAVMIIAAILFVYSFFFTGDVDSSLIERLLTAAIAAVALGVAAVPEGLPAVVTISMAFGTQKMLKKNVLVRRLNSVETLGSVDVICSDKTGTLTTGEMTVTKLWNLSGDYHVSGAGYSLEGEVSDDKGGVVNDNKDVEELLATGMYCNNATLSPKPVGDPTEVALLVSAVKAGLKNSASRLKEVPFSSERKRMSVLVKDKSNNIVYMKGAPEIVLKNCSKVLVKGQVKKLTSTYKKKIIDQNTHMAEQALRVLGFAYKDVGKAKEVTENEMIFVGLQGMSDPPRKEIAPTMELCIESGIKVIMITGDNPQTAKAVARQIGLGERCFTGVELNKLSDEQFDKAVDVTSIYARVSPDFKLRIIESLKKKGHIVAMTGDGVNDAPALKKADIGVAMGITGTDVSKEASDMVLLDDNFSSIVAAVTEGRGIFHNIRKFVSYLISANLAEVIIVFVGAIIFKDILLTAVMLLWINVVTDGLPAIAIGLDPAEDGVMKRSPKDFQQEIITRSEWYKMLSFSLIISVAVLYLYWLNIGKGEDIARTVAFSGLVIFELARIYMIRFGYKLPIFSNVYLLGSVVISALLQLSILYIAPLREMFGLSEIAIPQWVPIITIAALILFLPQLIKKISGKDEPVLE